MNGAAGAGGLLISVRPVVAIQVCASVRVPVSPTLTRGWPFIDWYTFVLSNKAQCVPLPMMNIPSDTYKIFILMRHE